MRYPASARRRATCDQSRRVAGKPCRSSTGSPAPKSSKPMRASPRATVAIHRRLSRSIPAFYCRIPCEGTGARYGDLRLLHNSPSEAEHRSLGRDAEKSNVKLKPFRLAHIAEEVFVLPPGPRLMHELLHNA